MKGKTREREKRKTDRRKNEEKRGKIRKDADADTPRNTSGTMATIEQCNPEW